MILIIFGVWIGCLVMVVRSGMHGVRIWKTSRAHRNPAEAQTLRFLGLNLIEPALNAVLVPGLVWLLRPYFWDYLMEADGPFRFSSGQALLVTLPVALLLLLPLIGWNSADQRCRGINRRLVGLGVLRWGVTAIVLASPFFMFLGLYLLVFSLGWIKQQAQHPYQAVGLGPEGVMVGELQDFGASNPPNVRI